MKILCINDLHCFGPIELMPINDAISIAKASPYPVYWLGDNLDFANAYKHDLPTMLILANLLFKSFNMIAGNHELDKMDAPNFVYLNDDKILLMHGDIASWGKARAYNFRSQEPGAGWIKRNLISRPLDALRHLITVRPNATLLEFIREAKMLHSSLEYVVMGHSHPAQRLEFTHQGVKCVILPRGCNLVEMDA